MGAYIAPFLQLTLQQTWARSLLFNTYTHISIHIIIYILYYAHIGIHIRGATDEPAKNN